ncbi:DUF4158 domain-containing protein [Micromonospora sp. RTGN7]|uniref:DUF4158 domain-containing protein n=1 Tax=Micromonospora sp. RTGN7 TaxID=3016526 RepID=UPI0029FF31CB|nr:DUF4158 domain-containing protein [Micromonospora sp. RTGN7]
MTDDQIAQFGRFAAVPPDQEALERFLFLDDADRELVATRRGDHNRLGFVLQLVTVRFLGTFLPDPLDVPLVVLDYVAAQVGAADSSCVKRYTEREKTRLEHHPGWDGDNEISSVWNRTGQKLTIFDNDNYTGTRICLNAGEYVAELGPERSFDNEAESYKLAGNCL